MSELIVSRQQRVLLLTLNRPPFYHRLTQCKNVRQPVNIVSHFARADEPKCGATEKQLAIFNTFCEGKPGQRSIAASGGILLWPQSHFDWVQQTSNYSGRKTTE